MLHPYPSIQIHPSGHQVCGGVGFLDVDIPMPPPLEAQFVYATL